MTEPSPKKEGSPENDGPPADKTQQMPRDATNIGIEVAGHLRLRDCNRITKKEN